MPRVSRALVALAALATVGVAPAARADTAPAPATADAKATPEAKAAPGVVVWPTMTPAGDDPGGLPLHKPVELTEPTLALRAQELDATLRDGVQDLGFVLDVADPGPTSGHTRDEDMLARAADGASVRSTARSTPGGTWVVSARLEAAGAGTFLLRMVAAPRGGVDLRVRVARVKAEDVSVRGLILLRDLLATSNAAAVTETPEAKCLGCASLENVNTEGLRSPGRALLALNGGLFGGYVGYSLQRASGSTDPRVLYPLLALGTGIGVGTALLVSDEWDLSTGDAWFLAAGAWWGAGAGVLVANGREAPLTDRYAYGVVSGFGGIALATFALTRKRMDEGNALLTHSGGALGLFVGGLAELAYKGTTTGTPDTGAGYGAAIGVVGAGALATFVRVSPSRVALVDLGAALGALGGAAAASPLLFQDVTTAKSRGFLAATLGGTAVGGALAWYFTRSDTRDTQPRHALLNGTPTAGVIGTSATPTGTVPAYGVGWVSSF